MYYINKTWYNKLMAYGDRRQQAARYNARHQKPLNYIEPNRDGECIVVKKADPEKLKELELKRQNNPMYGKKQRYVNFGRSLKNDS